LRTFHLHPTGITPATEPEHKALLREEYGVEDEWPVIAEPFLQWVIEDNFCAGRPAWQVRPPPISPDLAAPRSTSPHLAAPRRTSPHRARFSPHLASPRSISRRGGS
jgi:hypothetical protein